MIRPPPPTLPFPPQVFNHRKRELAQSNCPLSEVMRWRHTATMQLLGVVYVCAGV